MVYNKKCDCQHILKLSFISLLTSYSQKSLLQNSAPLQSKPRVPPFSSAKDHTMQREIQLRKPMQTNLCQQNKTQHARHEQQTDEIDQDYKTGSRIWIMIRHLIWINASAKAIQLDSYLPCIHVCSMHAHVRTCLCTQ